MSDHINILNKSVSKFFLEYKRMSNKDFYIKAKEFENEIHILNETEINFNNSAMKVTQQDEFTRSEQSFYNRHLRTAISVYKDKRVLLDRISGKIDEKIKDISEIEAEFNKALENGETIRINDLLIKYAKKVVSFCEVINEGPSLQNYIFKTIPKMVNELMALYKTKKKELNSSLKHINFTKSIEKISHQYNDTKNQFINLNLDKAAVNVRGIIKSFVSFEESAPTGSTSPKIALVESLR